MDGNSNTLLKEDEKTLLDDADHDCVDDYPVNDEEISILDDTSIPSEYIIEYKDAKIAPSPILPVVNYAPFINPVKVNGNLYCIALKWQNQMPKGNISYMGSSVANTYKRISNGFTTFRLVAKTIKVNYPASKANLAKAEADAIAAVLKADNNHQKGPNDYFLIVNGLFGSHTSISRHIAHLGNTLITTANHENGHSLGLLHSNVLTPNRKDGSSRDGTSFMSIYSSGNLTASQSYYMGWLNGMVSLYDFPEKVSFQIQKLDAPLIDGNLKAVILAPIATDTTDAKDTTDTPQKTLFLSWPKFKNEHYLSIHSTYGGKNLGSLREKVFANQIEYKGFIIEKTAENDEFITVDISRTPTPSPTPKP